MIHTFFIVIQYIGILILMVQAFYMISCKPTKQQRHLLFLILAMCITFAGYLLELEAETQKEAMMAVRFSYFGKPFLVLCQFLFVMQTCKVKISERMESIFCRYSCYRCNGGADL